MKKLVWNPSHPPEPSMNSDYPEIPFCVSTCRYHDGKRCKILGHQPETACIPMLSSLLPTSELDVALLRYPDCKNCRKLSAEVLGLRDKMDFTVSPLELFKMRVLAEKHEVSSELNNLKIILGRVKTRGWALIRLED